METDETHTHVVLEEPFVLRLKEQRQMAGH